MLSHAFMAAHNTLQPARRRGGSITKNTTTINDKEIFTHIQKCNDDARCQTLCVCLFACPAGAARVF